MQNKLFKWNNNHKLKQKPETSLSILAWAPSL